MHQYQKLHISQPQIENTAKFCNCLSIPQITSCARKFMRKFLPKQIESYLMRIPTINVSSSKSAKSLLRRSDIDFADNEELKNPETMGIHFEVGLRKFDIELNWHVLFFRCIWLCFRQFTLFEIMQFASSLLLSINREQKRMKMSAVIKLN